MSMALVECKKLMAGGKGMVSGGFGIETNPPVSNNAAGWRTVTETSNRSIAMLTLKGSITQ